MPGKRDKERLVEIACHTWAFHDLRLSEALGTAARLGFRRVDLGFGHHLNPARAAHPQQRIAIAQETLEDLRLYALRIGDMTLRLAHLSGLDEEKSHTELQLFGALLPLTKALGSPGISVMIGARPEADAETTAIERAIQALQSMQAGAARFGLALSIHPQAETLITTPRLAQELIEQVPGLKITLDWGAATALKFKSTEIQALLPHTRHVQMRPAAPGRSQVPIARSKLEIAEAIAMLREAQYQGVISVALLPATAWKAPARYALISEILALRDGIRDARGPA